MMTLLIMVLFICVDRFRARGPNLQYLAKITVHLCIICSIYCYNASTYAVQINYANHMFNYLETKIIKSL